MWRFATVFRERLGLPPHRYIRAQRVRLAQALLRQGMPAATAASEHSLGLTTCWIERRHGQPGFGGTLAVREIIRPDYHCHTLAQLADAVDAAR